MATTTTPGPDFGQDDIPRESSAHTEETTGERKPLSLPALYLTGSRWDRSRHPLDLLARMMMLTVQGTAAATGRARLWLRMAAVLLFGVFTFEATMWFLVLNGLVQLNNRDVARRGSLFAFAGSVLLAGMMFVMEWSIMVSDTSPRATGGAWRWRLRVASRGLFIALTAVITYLPVELIGFGPSVELQVFKRNLRESVVEATRKTIHDIEERKSVITELAATTGIGRNTPLGSTSVAVLGQQLGVAVQVGYAAAVRAQEDVERKGQAANAARRNLTARQGRLDQTRREPVDGLSPEARQDRQKRIDDLTKDVAGLEGAKRGADAELDRAITAKDNACIALIKLKAPLQNFAVGPSAVLPGCTAPEVQSSTGGAPPEGPIQKQIERLQRGYSDFVDQVQNTREQSDVNLATSAFQFSHAGADADERLYMIKDMTLGRPMRVPILLYNGKPFADQGTWIDIPEVRAVQRIFVDATKAMDAQEQQEAERMRPVALAKSVGLFFLAMVVPAVALVFKVTAGPELRNYYSSRYQAMRGHPEALEETTIDRLLDEEEDSDRRQPPRGRRRHGGTDKYDDPSHGDGNENGHWR